MPPRRSRARVATARAPAAASSQNSHNANPAKVVAVRDIDAFSRLLDRAGEEGVVCVMFTSAWAPNARVLRSLFSDLAAHGRTAFGSEVRFAAVDTGGGGGSENSSSVFGGGGGNNDGGRAAASLAEQCGVRALPAFQIWLGGELQVSLGGAEAAAVVVSAEEAKAEEEEAAASSRGAETFLRRAAGGLAERLRRLSGKASSSSSSSFSSSSSSVSLRTRLAEELRARAGPPIPSRSWLSRVLWGPAGKAYEQRWRLLAGAAAAALVAAAVGSAKSARAARRWREEVYDELPTEAHRKQARARAVARLAGRRAELGGLSFLAPAGYLLRWASGRGGARGGDGPLGPRFSPSEFADILDPEPPPMPDIDFDNQVDGDKVKAWLLESRRLAREQRRRLAGERMEEEAEALGREVKRWEYTKAVEHEEEEKRREEEERRRMRRQGGREELSSSSSSSSPSSLPRGSSKERVGAVLAGDVEHVDIRGVYRRLAGK